MGKIKANRRTIYDLAKGVISASRAIIANNRVSQERVEARLAICQDCRLVEVYEKHYGGGREPQLLLRCSICGCKITRNTRLLNLAAHEEDHAAGYGCKAPGGSKWKKAGV